MGGAPPHPLWTDWKPPTLSAAAAAAAATFMTEPLLNCTAHVTVEIIIAVATCLVEIFFLLFPLNP